MSFHAACLLEIERGHLTWKDDFQRLQSTTLAGGILTQQNSGTARSRNPNENPIMFCRAFQRGVCDEQNDHFGDVQGVVRFVRHICAACWLKNRRKASHPEGSEECPVVNSVQE